MLLRHGWFGELLPLGKAEWLFPRCHIELSKGPDFKAKTSRKPQSPRRFTATNRFTWVCCFCFHQPPLSAHYHLHSIAEVLSSSRFFSYCPQQSRLRSLTVFLLVTRWNGKQTLCWITTLVQLCMLSCFAFLQVFILVGVVVLSYFF